MRELQKDTHTDNKAREPMSESWLVVRYRLLGLCTVLYEL